MGIDTSIYQNALRAPRSVQDYTNEALQGVAAQQNLLSARMQMQQQQAAVADQNALRQYLAGGDTGEALEKGLSQRGFLKESLLVGKDRRENAKTEAEMASKQMETKKQKYAIGRDLIQGAYLAYDDALKKTGNPQQAQEVANQAYMGGVQQLHANGIFDDGDLQRAGAFDPNVAKAFLDRDKEMTLRLTAARDQQKTANDVMIPDGKGGYTPNQPVINAKKSVAKAGATNISVNTEKSLLTTMGEKLGGQLDSSLAGAKSAVGAISTAGRLMDAIESGKVIAGPGANVRLTGLQIGQVLGVGGKDASEQLSNTRQAMQAMAQLELDAAQQMKGQGQITEAERDIIRRAAGGDITMTVPELTMLAGAVDKTARWRISNHETNVQQLGKMPNANVLMPFYKVDAPPPRAAAKRREPPASAGQFKYIGKE